MAQTLWSVKITQWCPTLLPHGPFMTEGPARLLCRWNSPGKNTGVGSHSLLQGIFPTQGSNLSLLHCKQILYHLSHQGSPIGKKWTYTEKNTLFLNSFCDETLRTWAPLSPETKCVIAIRRQWVQVPVWVLANGFKSYFSCVVSCSYKGEWFSNRRFLFLKDQVLQVAEKGSILGMGMAWGRDNVVGVWEGRLGPDGKGPSRSC